MDEAMRLRKRRDTAWENTFDAEVDKAVASDGEDVEITVLGGPPVIGHRLDHAVKKMRANGYRLTRVVPGAVEEAWNAHFERLS